MIRAIVWKGRDVEGMWFAALVDDFRPARRGLDGVFNQRLVPYGSRMRRTHAGAMRAAQRLLKEGVES